MAAILIIASAQCSFGCEGPVPPTPTGGQQPPASPSVAQVTPLQVYAVRAAALRQRALDAGTVTYQEVVDAAYAPGVISRDLLASKANWRTSMSDRFAFITDYATLHEGAAVQPLEAIADANLQSTLVALYESTSHQISIAPVATDFAIFHEAGHALQRATLRARGLAAGLRADTNPITHAPLPSASARDATAMYRLRYLCSQDEFEVRLQDLNRFHAVLLGGRPILNATESVRALRALGIPLTYEETRDAFAVGGLTLLPETFAQETATAVVAPATIAVAFEDARELSLIRRLSLRIDPDSWPRVLAKMIFEAPGHL